MIYLKCLSNKLRKIFLNVDNLMLKHDIKLDNKHNFKLVFWWDESFQIQRANSMKEIYILKKIDEIYFKRTYADNRLKRFKIKNIEHSSTKQIEIHKMLNITSKDLIDAMKKSNIINKNVQVDDEVQSETVRNIVESSNIINQIFENDITDDNLSNSKTRTFMRELNLTFVARID